MALRQGCFFFSIFTYKVLSLSVYLLFFVKPDSVTHQSFPTAPCAPPPGNCGAFARLVGSGGGTLANLARPGDRAFANPGHNPEKCADVFEGMFS